MQVAPLLKEKDVVPSLFSVRLKQKEEITRMLNLNRDGELSEEEFWQGVWKVLIYDDYCRTILAPLFKVGELRKLGITLHLILHSERQAVPDVPAIYFISPSKENIRRVVKDCKDKLYDSCYLNFSSSISRPLMEELAQGVLEVEAVSRITKVFDQYLHFISLEDKLFTLAQENSYIAFNSSSISDTQAEDNVDAAANTLFCVLITLNQIPIIRCPRNTAASMVAKKLHEKLREHLLKSGSVVGDSSSFHRPVLILVDRNVDLSVMFHHTWTYQALVHDILDMKLNKVNFQMETEAESPVKPRETRSYDLDPSEPFWAANAGSPWPKVALEIQAQIKEYTAVMEEVNRLKTGPTSGDSVSQASVPTTGPLAEQAKGLGALVSGIPELTEKKRLIDMHVNIATALVDQIKQRNFDTYLKIEESIANSTQDKKEVLAVITANNSGTAEDKLRLFLNYYMSTPSIPEEDVQRFEAALQDAGADLRPLAYLKKAKAFSTSIIQGGRRGSSLASSSGSGSNLVKQGYRNVANLFQQGVNQIKMWIPSNKYLTLTRIVDCLMEMRTGTSLAVEEQYEYYDPKHTASQPSPPRRTSPFSHAIVFVIGGGNYVEFQNLQDYAKEQPRTEMQKQIIYGTTEMLNPSQFLEQLALLGD